jgi:polysaccharide chain length determinant protein (PEP-CTERM system associated)
MQEVIAQLLILLRGAWRYRWVAVAVAWLVALAGWVAVQFVPDQYQSKTQVYVDTESLLKPLLSGLAVNRDVMSQVAMMQTVMLSRPNLEKVAQQNDMLLDATNQGQMEAVVDRLARKIQLGRPSGPGTQNTFVVAYEDNNPQIAHGVVRSLLDTFMEGSLGIKRSDAGVAQRFLQTQIAD